MKKNALMVSLVPDDVGKPTVKLEKTAVQDGTCLWENPIFESVKLVRDSKSGILHEKIYHFIVATVRTCSCNFILLYTQVKDMLVGKFKTFLWILVGFFKIWLLGRSLN